MNHPLGAFGEIYNHQNAMKHLECIEAQLAFHLNLDEQNGSIRRQLCIMATAGTLDEDSNRLIPDWHQMISSVYRKRNK